MVNFECIATGLHWRVISHANHFYVIHEHGIHEVELVRKELAIDANWAIEMLNWNYDFVGSSSQMKYFVGFNLIQKPDILDYVEIQEKNHPIFTKFRRLLKRR